MEKDKLYLINKIFNDKKVRTVWNKESEKYYVSVVDVVGIISDSKNKQAYWRKLKQRFKEEGNETVTNCHTLKLKAQDGKYRMTDVTDIEGMFRISKTESKYKEIMLILKVKLIKYIIKLRKI